MANASKKPSAAKTPTIHKDLIAEAKEEIRRAMEKKTAVAKTEKPKKTYQKKCTYMPYQKKDGTISHQIGFYNEASPGNSYSAIRGSELFAEFILKAIDAGHRDTVENAIIKAKAGKQMTSSDDND